MMRLGTAGEAVYREHPIKILRYSAKNLWLLIFPLLRSLRFYPFSLQNLIDWGAGAWFDLLVALLILGIGTLRWHACTYYFDEVSIRSQSGLLLRRGTGDPAGTHCLHGGGTPVLPPPSAGSLFADQHRSRCCAGSGYAPDLVSAGSAPAAAAHSRAAKWQHRCGGVSHAGVANAVVLGVVLQQLFRCDIHCHHLLSGRTHHFRSGAAVSGTANSGRCHRQSVDSVPRRAANRHYDRHCDSGVVADLVRAEPAAVRQIPHAVWGGVHLGAHGDPHPPAVSSAGQRHYFPRPAAESADEDIRHGIPSHSLPRLRQPAGYAAGADSADSEKKAHMHYWKSCTRYRSWSTRNFMHAPTSGFSGPLCGRR